jgi:hypothetical protein
VDDLEADGDTVFTIDLTVSSSDAGINNALWTLDSQNIDDDILRLSVTSCSTTEAGGSCTVAISFSNWLSHFDRLSVALSNGDVTEGSLSISSFVVDASNYSTPVSLVITGVDDLLDDGDITYDVGVTANLTYITSAAGVITQHNKPIRNETVVVTNIDDDTAGLNVTQNGTITNEAGTITARFTVALLSEPLLPVVLKPVSLDPTEGTFDVAALQFYKSNWQTAQTVIVQGVDDKVRDGDIVYTIEIVGDTAAAGSSPEYEGIKKQLSFTNLDDDVVGIDVTMASSVTTESGDRASFTMKLTSEPLAAVIYTLSTDDSSEGQVESSIIAVLAPDNWNIGVVVEVSGQPDDEADGDVDYHITAMPVISEDTAYKALAPAQVKLTNLDDPARRVRVAMTPTQCVTTELNAGECLVTLTVTGWYSGSNQFNQARYRLPFEKLTVTLSSSNMNEGLVACSYGVDCVSSGGTFAGESVTVTFAGPGTKTFRLVGQDDNRVDGDVAYTVGISGVVKTGDAANTALFASQMTKEVLAVNIDDDVAGMRAQTDNCDSTSELGDYCDIEDAVKQPAQPRMPVLTKVRPQPE